MRPQTPAVVNTFLPGVIGGMAATSCIRLESEESLIDSAAEPAPIFARIQRAPVPGAFFSPPPDGTLLGAARISRRIHSVWRKYGQTVVLFRHPTQIASFYWWHIQTGVTGSIEELPGQKTLIGVTFSETPAQFCVWAADLDAGSGETTLLHRYLYESDTGQPTFVGPSTIAPASSGQPVSTFQFALVADNVVRVGYKNDLLNTGSVEYPAVYNGPPRPSPFTGFDAIRIDTITGGIGIGMIDHLGTWLSAPFLTYIRPDVSVSLDTGIFIGLSAKRTHDQAWVQYRSGGIVNPIPRGLGAGSVARAARGSLGPDWSISWEWLSSTTDCLLSATTWTVANSFLVGGSYVPALSGGSPPEGFWGDAATTNRDLRIFSSKTGVCEFYRGTNAFIPSASFGFVSGELVHGPLGGSKVRSGPAEWATPSINPSLGPGASSSGDLFTSIPDNPALFVLGDSAPRPGSNNIIDRLFPAGDWAESAADLSPDNRIGTLDSPSLSQPW